MNATEMPQFMPDFIISWDSSDKDYTCVCIAQIKKDGTKIISELIGISHEKSGCVSLRQILEEHENRKRLEIIKEVKAE